MVAPNHQLRSMGSSYYQDMQEQLGTGSIKALARCISFVENNVPGTAAFLENLPHNHTPVIGITGPPGAGKSTLVDGLIDYWVKAGYKIGVVCVDPSSPFNLGAMLGDRIRMSEWYSHPQVFIRSLATRGSLGGLHPHILEITEVMKASGFDFVLVETVGVGQSEVEIAGLADCTVVVVVPEAGDEIQTMKAGLMEIADVFVVNKADRPDAEKLVRSLRQMMAPAFLSKPFEIEIIKTIAQEKEGLPTLAIAIEKVLQLGHTNERRRWLLAEKAWHLIQQQKMNAISKQLLRQQIANEDMEKFNLYRFVKQWM